MNRLRKTKRPVRAVPWHVELRRLAEAHFRHDQLVAARAPAAEIRAIKREIKTAAGDVARARQRYGF